MSPRPDERTRRKTSWRVGIRGRPYRDLTGGGHGRSALTCCRYCERGLPTDDSTHHLDQDAVLLQRRRDVLPPHSYAGDSWPNVGSALLHFFVFAA